jgi:hypothetical protein
MKNKKLELKKRVARAYPLTFHIAGQHHNELRMHLSQDQVDGLHFAWSLMGGEKGAILAQCFPLGHYAHLGVMKHPRAILVLRALKKKIKGK